MYVFDEPSVGLHPRDVHRLNELLQQLRDRGNTVLVVEHDPDVIKVADHIKRGLLVRMPFWKSAGRPLIMCGKGRDVQEFVERGHADRKIYETGGFGQKRFPFRRRQTADQERAQS